MHRLGGRAGGQHSRDADGLLLASTASSLPAMAVGAMAYQCQMAYTCARSFPLDNQQVPKQQAPGGQRTWHLAHNCEAGHIPQQHQAVGRGGDQLAAVC